MSVWGKPAGGAWADNVDEEEAAGVHAPPKAFPTLGNAGKAVADDDFPDLSVAAKVKESKKKKKAPKQTLSLTDFLKSDVGGGPGLGSRRGGDVDILSLPTRPRGEGEERPDRPLGGGFRDYGGGRDGTRGRYGDDERRPRHGEEEDMGPSRAEMSDNWGADRKPMAAGGDDRGRGGFGGGFRDRDSGGFRDRDGVGGGGFRDRSREDFPDGPSRADEVDDWGKSKQFVPGGGGGGGGRGFEDRPRGGGGFRERSPHDPREPSRADTEDRWSKLAACWAACAIPADPTAFEDRPRREFDDYAPPPRRGFGFGDRPGSREPSRDRWERGPRDGSRDARPHSRDLSQERTWRPAGAPGGGGGDPGRERPRLNLAPRSAAAAAGAAAPGGGASNASVFGAARPREEVLREQGRDAVKEDLALEHEAVDRPESAEEAALRRQIADLQLRVEAGEADAEYQGQEGRQEAAGEEEEGGKDGKGGKDGEEEEEEGPARTVAQTLEALEAQLLKLQLDLDARAKYARSAAARDEEHARERPPRVREPSPGGEGWRRGAGDGANGGPAPRGFRDDRPARPPSGAAGHDDRPPRRGGFEERGRRDSFPPRDRDSSRDKPRW
ncbi:hypothetical protein CHLNCDRAFT_140448 [Chlorella variabilis]|uniref:Uncharacterized protein n=1 Tax=Chlorella variabilis TaxID=554065 RepID=E1Z5E6_CHLVA|nr:hypothetical protein CHLNCDRAFT_140448 [Chlorella variabilis]EFN58747.1 hypothetical protein CHLNCDRAFT_140448 [Chlorella variabilis]|eukprot:XP_005850849.1 hypothetical protein CHLNCDRAFT_140448 [Chlorella variabilis]